MGICTRPPPLPAPGSGAALVLEEKKCDGNLSLSRTLAAVGSGVFAVLKGCMAISASAAITAACVRKEIACARLDCRGLSKRKRCNGAPFAELICHFSEVKATAKFPRMRLIKPPPELAEENKERRQDWRMGGLRAHLRLSHAPRRDGRRMGGEKRSAADWLPAKVRLGNTRRLNDREPQAQQNLSTLFAGQRASRGGK